MNDKILHQKCTGPESGPYRYSMSLFHLRVWSLGLFGKAGQKEKIIRKGRDMKEVVVKKSGYAFCSVNYHTHSH